MKDTEFKKPLPWRIDLGQDPSDDICEAELDTEFIPLIEGPEYFVFYMGKANCPYGIQLTWCMSSEGETAFYNRRKNGLDPNKPDFFELQEREEDYQKHVGWSTTSTDAYGLRHRSTGPTNLSVTYKEVNGKKTYTTNKRYFIKGQEITEERFKQQYLMYHLQEYKPLTRVQVKKLVGDYEAECVQHLLNTGLKPTKAENYRLLLWW